MNKCEVGHTEKRNFEFQCQMNDGWVRSVVEERDFRMLILNTVVNVKHWLLAKK